MLIGRPVVFGLAAGGESGVARVLRLLLDELALSCRLAGIKSCASVPRGLVIAPGEPLPLAVARSRL